MNSLPRTDIEDIIGKKLLGFYAVPLREQVALDGDYQSEINFIIEKIEGFMVILPKHSNPNDLESDKELRLYWSEEIQNNLATTSQFKKLKPKKFLLKDFGKVIVFKYSNINPYANSDEKSSELKIETEFATISIHAFGVVPFIYLSVTRNSL